MCIRDRYRRDDNRYIVHGHKGKAVVHDLDGYNYEIISGDPLDLESSQHNLTSEESFNISLECDYPDSLFQICQLMKSKRAGDVLVCAADGHDLRDFWEYPEHKGSHGSLHKDHMLMPILTNQKGLISKPIRSNKIHSVIKEWLG